MRLVSCHGCAEKFVTKHYRQNHCSPECAEVTKQARNIVNVRRHHLKKFYGVTPDDYERMLEMQNGRCAICRSPADTSFHKRLCIDHNHETGAVRGLLCSKCNSAIGLLNDSPELMYKAAEYVS